jgi:hypothetical protein
MHSDGTLTAPFFVLPESMLAGGARPPLDELYVIVNSKLGPEFDMTARSVPGVLGRSIAVALTWAMRAQLALVQVGAQRSGINLHIAHVGSGFSHPARGLFDGKYMQALYEFGMAAGKDGTAFVGALPELTVRGSNEPR